MEDAPMETLTPIVARCGYRCDLCPAYKENIHGPADRQRTSDGWFKYYGFRIPPEQIGCDGCRDERPEARRIDTTCPIRPCAITRGVETCGQCPKCGCKQFKTRDVTREGVEKRLGSPIPFEDYRWFVLPYERSELQHDHPKKKAAQGRKPR
jgi:hypothetical protein